MSASECLRQSSTQSYQIKTEIEDPLSSDTTHEFKFDINENSTANTNSLQPKNSVLVMSKPNNLLSAQPATSKKFKTIVNTKNNSILNNNANYF